MAFDQSNFVGPTPDNAYVTPSIQAVRVIEVFTDAETELAKEYGGTEAIGSILYRSVSESNDTTESGDVQYTGQAFPLNTNNYTLPLKNEIVLLVKGPDQSLGTSGENDIKYYMSVISLFNHPHINAYPVFDDPGSEVNIGENIEYQEKLAPLQLFPGDTILQGRLGQTLRFSGGSGSLNPYTTDENKNKPFTILTNGLTNKNDRKEGFIPVIENIDEDDASMYFTSDHTVPLTLSSTKRDSYDDVPDEPSKYTGSQILLNAGRLTFNAKVDDILMSSVNSIGLNSKTVNIDADDYMCIDAEKIFLGKQARSGSNISKQPVMLGHEVERYLQDLLDVLLSMSGAMISASNGGGPVASLVKSGTSSRVKLQSLKASLNPRGSSTLKSRKTFVE